MIFGTDSQASITCPLKRIHAEFQIRYLKMDCYSANPTCNEAMWEMWGTECVWCAKNNTPGFAVDAEYTKLKSSWNCSDGVVVTDICPPSVTQVRKSAQSVTSRVFRV